MATAFASTADLEEKTIAFDRLADGAYAFTAESDPNTGVMFEHCLPFNVSRAFDEADGLRDSRIWTPDGHRDMWHSLQDALKQLSGD